MVNGGQTIEEQLETGGPSGQDPRTEFLRPKTRFEPGPQGVDVRTQLGLRRQAASPISQPTPEEIRQTFITSEVARIDSSKAAQQEAIDNIKAVIAKRNEELVTAEGDRNRLLTERNDRDADRINDLQRGIQNLEASKSQVASGAVSASSLIQQSAGIVSGAEETREQRIEEGTPLQAQRVAQREAEEEFRLARIEEQDRAAEVIQQPELRPVTSQSVIEDTQEEPSVIGTLFSSGLIGTPLIPTERDIDIAKDIREQGIFRGALLSPKAAGISFTTSTLAPDITFSQIKQDLSTRGLTSRVVGEFIPTTPLETGILAATPAVVGKLPTIGRIATGFTFGGFGGKTALDVSLPTEQRIVGGAVGVLGLTGALVETLPFVRGGFARLRTPSRVVTRPGLKTDIKVIDPVRGITGEKIGIIPPGSGVSKRGFKPGAGATERGGFGFTLAEQKRGFAGKDTILTSGQRGLIKKSDIGGIVSPDPKIGPEFFFSPADPVTGIPQLRTSRIGLRDLFKFPKGAKFGLPKFDRPQILVSDKVRVSAKQLTPSTELEVVTGAFKVVKQLPPAIIKGQEVQVFKVGFGALPKPSGRVSTLTTSFTETIPVTSALPSFGITGLVSKTPTSQVVPSRVISPIVLPTTTRPTRRPSLPSSPVPSRGLSPIKSPPILPSLVPSIRSPPVIPPSLPPTIRSPPISPPFFPSIKPPKRPPKRDDEQRRGIDRPRTKGTRDIIGRVIRPSLTGIVTGGIGLPGEFAPGLGISPATLRGLGVPVKRKKKGKKKKK